MSNRRALWHRLKKVEAGGDGEYQRFIASVLADCDVLAGSPAHIELLAAFQVRSGRSEPLPWNDPTYDNHLKQRVFRLDGPNAPDEPIPENPIL